ncbi:MAG: hypothetical protein WCO48_02690 [Candidatus Taylorbacteria bacterium]
MNERFQSNFQSESDNNKLEKEVQIKKLDALYHEAETAFETGGREQAKPYLPKVYDDLMLLNKRNKDDWENQWIYNPEGDLTEDQFNAFNLRRKLLSNAIGIMTASGAVRHDLNKID